MTTSTNIEHPDGLEQLSTLILKVNGEDTLFRLMSCALSTSEAVAVWSDGGAITVHYDNRLGYSAYIRLSPGYAALAFMGPGTSEVRSDGHPTASSAVSAALEHMEQNLSIWSKPVASLRDQLKA